MDFKKGESLIDKTINYVFIGSCTNSRIEDFRIAAQYVKGKQKADNVTAWLVPGSKQVESQIIEEGLKSGHCSAVLGWLSEWDKQHIRRLQIACQEKNAHCWLWPQREADTSGSPAPVRMQVRRNSSSTLEVNLLKCRGTWPGTPFTVSLPQRPATPHC